MTNNINLKDNNIKSEKEILDETLKELEFQSVLNQISKYCSSDPGRDIIFKSEPNEDLEWLREEHDLLDEMSRLLTEDDDVPLEGFTDVRNKLHKSHIQNAVLTSTEILTIMDSIHASRIIKHFFQARQEKYPLLYHEAILLHENRFLEKHITEAIDENGEVRDNATRELSRIRREIFEKSNYLRSRLQKILQRVSDDDMTQEDFYSIREGRFVIPVKSEHKRHIPGIIHGMSQTGSTVFLEPSEIFELNNDLSMLDNEEKREVYKILSNLTNEIGEEASLFLESVDIISHLDSLMAKGKYALEYGGIKPMIHDENSIFLNNIRHPILSQSRGLKKVIPLSIEFNDNSRGHLISGPNAGGKTVALKSIGLNIAMALSGIFPLGECHTNYRRIYSSIGDHQSIENDLSTFSSQILNLKHILSNCTSDALILIDEIGSGTDPQEGSALAAGVMDTFLELKVFFVSTTHQSSLKSYALTRNEIENASLEFDENLLKPTYKFLSGIPGNSYAFVLAESLGLNRLVLERARKYIGSRQTELEQSISVLQKYKNEAEDYRMKMFEEKQKMEQARIDYEGRLKVIKEKRTEIVEEAQSEASEILRNANSLIERTIKEIREEKRPVSEIKQEFFVQKKTIDEAVDKLQKPEPIRELKQFSEGDYVVMDGSTSVGTIITVTEDNSHAVVDFNGLKFTVPIEQITISKAEKKKASMSQSFDSFDARATLDLRGMRAEAALNETDVFINEAIINDLEKVSIIHGKGTGILRKVIHEFLKNHPSINSYRLGDMLEGGDGITIVYL